MNSFDFISELVKGIGHVLDADLTFVSRAVDMPVTRARGIVGYKTGLLANHGNSTYRIIRAN